MGDLVGELTAYQQLREHEDNKKIATDNRRIATENLVKYIKGLMFITSLNGECFIKGAYVIHDSNNKLVECLKMLITHRFTIGTHRTFIKCDQNPSSHTGLDCNILYEINLNSHNTKIEIKTGECSGLANNSDNNIVDCGEIVYKNLKFNIIGNTNYIYLKLETAPTMSFNHMRNLGYTSNKGTCIGWRDNCIKSDAQCHNKNQKTKIYLKCNKDSDNKSEIDISNGINTWNKLKSEWRVQDNNDTYFVAEEVNTFIWDNCINIPDHDGGKKDKKQKSKKTKK